MPEVQRVAVVRMSPDSVNNLFAFLDRVEVKGLKELGAMNEIVNAVQSAQVETLTPQAQPVPVPAKEAE